MEEKPRNCVGCAKMLKAMLNKAHQWGYIESNPCARMKTPKYEADEKVIYNEEGLEEMLKLLPSQELKYELYTLFAVLCGFRREEIAGLKWDDIDFDKMNFISFGQPSWKKVKEQLKVKQKPKNQNEP